MPFIKYAGNEEFFYRDGKDRLWIYRQGDYKNNGPHYEILGRNYQEQKEKIRSVPNSIEEMFYRNNGA